MQLYVFDLVGVGIIAPGESASVEIEGLPYTFLAQQGSRWGTCGQNDQVSWALIRE